MVMRIGFSLVFLALMTFLVICARKSFKSTKSIALYVGYLDIALIPPLIGNLLIIGSATEIISIIGYNIYFIGMDVAMIALAKFSVVYCKGYEKLHKIPVFVYIAVAIDLIQVLFNPFTGHVFKVEKVFFHDYPYYKLIPSTGLIIHRVIDYSIFLCVIVIFTLVIIKTAKIYREKYVLILLSMIIIGVWQSVYIISGSPVDMSMIGYGVFGLLVYYLSIHYKPLRLLDRMLSSVASNMKEAIFVYAPTGRCVWTNDTGRKFVDLGDDDIESVSEKLTAIFGKKSFTTKDWKEDVTIGSGDDTEYYSLENYFVSEDSKHLAGSYLIIRNKTEEQRKIKEELYASTHDSMTGLYTKEHLYRRIKETIDENEDETYIVIYIDVKNFKIVNDIFSTQFGDKALIQIANWIRNNVEDRGLYGRLAGDTFGVLITREQYEKDKEKVEGELLNFVVTDGSIEHNLVIHIGAYEIDDRNTDVSVMFDRAHLAISTLNNNYKQHIAFYDKNLREKMLWNQKITAGLSSAISTMQIRPYLQPITDRNGKVVGAEALARWIHPEDGFMSPAVFIPVLEKNGMIVEVDKHIWRCACKTLADWKGKHDDLFISVNISPKDFYYIDIVSEITGLVNEYKIDPKNLRVEITETVMMNDENDKFKMLEELRKKGFIVEMDDFGSGYSSLNLLKDMPVDVLKIDMKFLSSPDSGSKAQKIIRNIIRLSEELNIISLTEGVETDQQYSELSDMGCKLFQGYYFAKPLPITDFEEFAFASKQKKKEA